jgi:outer membrane lipopolysaccharide assembly protein LptE/RlpB
MNKFLHTAIAMAFAVSGVAVACDYHMKDDQALAPTATQKPLVAQKAPATTLTTKAKAAPKSTVSACKAGSCDNARPVQLVKGAGSSGS